MRLMRSAVYDADLVEFQLVGEEAMVNRSLRAFGECCVFVEDSVDSFRPIIEAKSSMWSFFDIGKRKYDKSYFYLGGYDWIGDGFDRRKYDILGELLME